MDRLFAGYDAAQAANEDRETQRRQQAEFLQGFLDAVDALTAILERWGERYRSAGDTADARDERTLRLVLETVHRALAVAGVERLPGVGELVDLEHQEVVAVRPLSEHAEDVIVDVVARGYLWRGTRLRPGKVVIAVSPERAAAR
jgi:molecular chaperone GrpE (heat shock protein)